MAMTYEEERAYRWLSQFPFKLYAWFMASAILFSLVAVVAFCLVVPAQMEMQFYRVLPAEIASGFIGVWRLGAYILGFFASFIFIGTAMTLLRTLRAAKLLVRVIDGKKS
jgi:hypothetical protein